VKARSGLSVRPPGLAGDLPVRGVLAFFASRAANAILLLGQTALIAQLYDTTETARFFVWWTIVWGASMWLSFGFYNLVPKLAAQARISGDLETLAGMRSIIRGTAPALALAIGPLLALLIPGAPLTEVLIGALACLAGAAGLGILNLVSALARGYGHPGLSGWVQGALPTLAAVVGIGVARLIDDRWTTLALTSAAGLLVAAVLSCLLVGRSVGPAAVRQTIMGKRRTRHDRDTWAVGLRTAVSEGNVYLPVWLASGLGVGALPLAALYAALRIVSAFSWPFTSVTAVVTPLIAEAQTRHDYARLRSLLWRSATAGFCSTALPAALGIVFAASLMKLVDPAYGVYGAALVILIAGRLLDAAAGPLAEALILGGRARLDLLNQTLGTIALTITAILLEPIVGVSGLAAGATASFLVANALQLLEVRWLLTSAWSPASAGAKDAAGASSAQP
jgi:O-antigen/teichoic acid export membrane protein